MRSSKRNAPAHALHEPDSSAARTNSRRRNFLLALGLGGAGAAALAARSLSSVAPEAEQPDDGAAAAGYQESEHVRRYYRTAKI